MARIRARARVNCLDNKKPRSILHRGEGHIMFECLAVSNSLKPTLSLYH